MYGRVSDTGMGPYPSRGALTLRTPAKQRSARWGWVSTLCGGGVDPGSRYVCSKFVGVADVPKDF